MTNPLQELMRDRLCTGVRHKDLRQILLHHYKEDGKPPLLLEEQLAKAKAWEAADRTNIIIAQTIAGATSEQVNAVTQAQTRQQRSPQSQRKCGWCGGQCHSRSECSATKPGTQCGNCHMKGNHFTRMCRAPKQTQGQYTRPKTFNNHSRGKYD